MSKEIIDALGAHYESLQGTPNEHMFEQVVGARRKRKQRLVGAISAFALSATCALLLLSWAARPATKTDNTVAGSIARYQMINSCLVERTTREVAPAR